jgi:hypothetical protein
MTGNEHAQQLRLVKESLALSPSETERHDVYPARCSRKPCPQCQRPMFRSNGRLLCANPNCSRGHDDTPEAA